MRQLSEANPIEHVVKCTNNRVALDVLAIYIAEALIPVSSQFRIGDHGGLEVEPAVAQVDHHVDVLGGHVHMKSILRGRDFRKPTPNCILLASRLGGTLTRAISY